jgi:hypothetical protein
MNRQARRYSVYSMTLAALVFGGAAPAGGPKDDGKEEIPFEEAQLFFELNDTDGDLGIHGLIDGDEWKRLRIEDPSERLLLNVQVRGRLRRQGLTELFFESAEPSFDELSPEQFFQRFPEGVYEIEGVTLDGEELEGETELSHVMPAPPGNVQVSGIPAAVNCDADPLPAVDPDEPVVISWAPVTGSHPEIGDSGPVEVAKYQFVLEVEVPELLEMSVDLPPGITEFEVPEALIGLADEFKFEIIVRADNGNQTAVESCFETE